MKSLCTCAALAVATAIAHGRIADALAPGDRAARSDAKANTLTPLDDSQSCTTQINALRQAVGLGEKAYTEISGATPNTDLQEFLAANSCNVLKSGAFNHIAGASSDIFVISATRKTDSAGDKISCDEAVEEWKSGFTQFGGEAPGPYKDNQEAYANGNAVGLVSLLSDKGQKIYCGTPTGCEDSGGNDTLICYFKPTGITAETKPVTSQVWRKLEEVMKFKPKLAANASQAAVVELVNAERTAEGLGLAQFASSEDPQNPPEEVLGALTCADINASTIDPTVVDGYTLIYSVKEGNTAPTAQEAIKFWQTGTQKLGVEVPPAFAKKPDAGDAEMYYDSAVAGFVSIMVDGERKMKCYDATGCDNAALICLLKDPTLVEAAKPISDDTWKKVLAVHVEKIAFEERAEGEGCLTEINDFRAQDGLNLKAFAALDGLKPSASSAISQGVTCEALRAGNAPFMFEGETSVSIMYYYGEPATCSAAVREWKNGIDLFKDVDIPPKYTADEPIYKNGAATNFISLVSEAAETKIKCFTVTGCKESALLCVLQPPVFKDGVAPISEETWQKVTDTVTSGAAAASAYGALLSSVVVAVGLFALNF